MPVSIVANQSSQYAQSAIKTRSNAVTLGTLQISSGSRVFSAVEDSAALAVGAGLKIDNAGLASARINAGAGVSMLQIADGALSNAADILVRMRTLAVQAASGQFNDSERGPIDLEYQALKSELDRLAGATQFNGVPLLNGQPGYALTESSSRAANGISAVGFNSNGPISISGTNPTLRYSYDAATEKMTLTRIDGGTASSQTLDLTAIMNATAGNGNNLSNGQSLDLNFQAIGVTLTLDPSFKRGTSILPTATASTGFSGATPFTPATTNLNNDGVQGLLDLAGGFNATTGALTLPLTTTAGAPGTVVLDGLAGIRYGINGGAAGASGAPTGDLTGSTSVEIYVDTASGPQLLGSVNTSTAGATANGSGTLVVSAGKGMMAGELQAASDNTVLSYKIGTGVVSGQDLLKVSIPAINVNTMGLGPTTVSTELGANAAIDVLKAAITLVSSARATVGAQQSRLSAVTDSIDVFKENNESARSALTDVDVPSAISELSNNQAMLQAGIAMLAQSNKIPEMLLTLLRG
ncbi:MAG TPA: flagellin [Alphaproteobacteria bacterium]|nr:flagellin [Alphaproteobacteria bacterium]